MLKTKYKFLIFPILLALVFGSFSAGKKFVQKTSKIKAEEVQNTEDTSKIANTSIPFIKNEGQVENPDVSYYANLLSGKAWVLPSGMRYGFLVNKNKDDQSSTDPEGMPHKDTNGNIVTAIPSPSGFLAVDEKFVDARTNLSPEGAEPSDANISSYIGSDSVNWKKNLQGFNSVNAGEVWPGIQVSYHASSRNVEKIFNVAAEANPDNIKIQIDGGGLSVSDIGELEIKTEIGSVVLSKPIAFQEIDGVKNNIVVNYKILDSKTYTFELGEYDPSLPLVIDPLIVATYLGGTNSDLGYTVRVASSGDVYITGYTFDGTFPSTPGVYDTTYNGGVTDQFIARFSYDLTTLKSATLIGGSGTIDGTSARLTFDASGNIFAMANTFSTDFPTTPGAFDTTHNGGTGDTVIFKMDSTLTTLLASTYLGSSADTDAPLSLSVASDGSLYVHGYSTGTNLPSTVGAYQTSSGGGEDMFVAKFSSNLSSLLALTYLGGSGGEHNASDRSMAFDASGNIVITGGESSANYPTTVGAYDTSQNGSWDIAVSILNPSLTTLVASTYLGGADDDDLLPFESVAISPSGDIYIVSNSRSANFPVTDSSTFGGVGDIAVAKFNSTLTSLSAAGYKGGSDRDNHTSAYFGADGNLYVSGYTYGNNFPATVGAYQTSFAGGTYDGIIMKLSSSLTTLASTFIGTSDYEFIYSITENSLGDIYAVFSTSPTSNFNFPTGGYRVTGNNSGDVVVTKFSNLLALNVTPTATIGSAVLDPIPGTNVNTSVSVADSDRGKTSLSIEYSRDGSSWLPASISSVSASSGSIVQTGSTISSIDTDLGVTVDVNFVWNIRNDLPDIYQRTVYLRVTPNDGNSNGTAVSRNFVATTNFGTAVPSQLLTAPVPPENGYKISINNSSVSTNDPIVEIQSTVGSDIKKMALLNTPGFEASSQEDFEQNKKWNLCTGRLICDSGDYTVYAKFFTLGGQPTSVVSSSIKLLSNNTTTNTDTENTADATIPSVAESKNPPGVSFTDKVVKSTENPTVYFITKYGKKLPYPNMKSFTSYGYKTTDIMLLSQDEINSFPDVIYVQLKNSSSIYELDNRANKTLVAKELVKTLTPEDVVQINSSHLSSFTDKK